MYTNPTIIDDSNFIFLPTGVYPEEYKSYYPIYYYDSYHKDYITPNKVNSYKHFVLSNNLNVNSAIVYEYWEKIPKEILSQSSNYCDNIYVSSFGRIYNRDSKILYKLIIRKDGYVGFKNTPVHRIVLYTFCPIQNFKYMTVDHISYNATENYLWNLKWTTLSDNIKRSFNAGHSCGYFKYGEENLNSTLSDYDAELVCAALASHQYTYKQIAISFGISERTVKHIADMDVRKDLGIKYKLDNNFDYRKAPRCTDRILPLQGVILE